MDRTNRWYWLTLLGLSACFADAGGVEEETAHEVAANSQALSASATTTATGAGAASAVLVQTTPGRPVLVATPSVPEYHVNDVTGTPDFVTFGASGLRLPESGTADAAQVALAFFQRYPTMFGTGDVAHQLSVQGTEHDSDAPLFDHVTLQQIWSGVPVWGGKLKLHLAPGGILRSIGGIYVRNPGVDVVPSLSEAQARTIAEQAAPLPPSTVTPLTLEVGRIDLGSIGPVQTGPKIVKVPPEPPVVLPPTVTALGLWVFPTRLSRAGVAQDNLVWGFELPHASLFVDAHSGELVAAMPRVQESRRIRDAGGAAPSLFAASRVVLVDGVPTSRIALHPVVPPMDALAATTMGLWATFGRSSWNGNNAHADFVVNTTSFPGFAHWNPFLSQFWFSPGSTVGDIVAHEFTHAVAGSSAGLFPVDESGALNEHYADVFGNIAFPDLIPNGWQVGEESSLKAIRDMMNPGSFGHPAHYSQIQRRGPGCTGLLDPLTKPACDAGNVHTNAGIGNRAAALLSDGNGAHAGIGRARMARVFADTLTKRLHPWSTYLDELHNSWEAARDLSAFGAIAAAVPNGASSAFGADTANEVLWAFNQVGVDRRLQSGWFEVGGLFPSRGTLTLNASKEAPANARVTDVELVVRAVGPTGIRFWTGTALASTGGTVTFPGGLFSVSITSSGIGTRSEQVTVAYTSNGLLSFDIAATARLTTIALPEVSEFVSGAQVHWNDFFLAGGKGDEVVNAGRSLNGDADCVIRQVQVELLNRAYEVITAQTPGATATVQGAGAGITSHGTGSRDLSVGVHWWFDPSAICRYQIRYTVEGTHCSMP